MKLPSQKFGWIGLVVCSLAAPAAAQLGVEFSYSFEPEPGERIVREVEGLRYEFPEADADIAELVLPKILAFRELRRKQVDEEAKAFTALFDGDELREALRKQVAHFCGREDASDQFNANFDAGLARIDEIAESWRKWSGDVGVARLWAAADAREFQKGELYHFGDMRFSLDGTEWSLHPPFVTQRLGLTAFEGKLHDFRPLTLDLPIFYKPGASADFVAAELEGFLANLPDTMRNSTAQTVARIARYWLFEYVVSTELKPLFADDGSVLHDAVTRMFFAQLIRNAAGEEAFKGVAMKIFGFSPPNEDDTVYAEFVDRVEAVDFLGDASKLDPDLRRTTVNLLGALLFEMRAETGSPFREFKAAGVEIPEGGFEVASFLAALNSVAAPGDDYRAGIEERKAYLIAGTRARLAKLTETAPAAADSKPPGNPDDPDRKSKTFGELTIRFPRDLDAAIDLAGPKIAETIATGKEALTKMFDQQAPAVVTFEQADADALLAYGLKGDLEVAGAFVGPANLLANPREIVMRIFEGKTVEVWYQEDLKEILKAGRTLRNFRYNESDNSVNFSVGFTLETSAPDIVGNAPAIEFPIALPSRPGSGIVAGVEAESRAALILEKGEWFLESYRKADLGFAEQLLGPTMRFLTEHEAVFLVTHEVAEAALVRTVIASPERRWFCDGLANWIAIQELDRRFGEGVGLATFEKIFPAEKFETLEAEIHLAGWRSVEDIQAGRWPVPEHQEAYYFFATRALLTALEDRDAAFLKRWLDEVRETRWNRTNIDTVAGAYRKLTGRDLIRIAVEASERSKS